MKKLITFAPRKLKPSKIMDKKKYFPSANRTPKTFWELILAALLALAACSEHVDMSARYVFTDDTVISYLQKHKDLYSSYLDLLYSVPVSKISETTVGQLLSARGHYTVFAPTNEAIQAFLDSLAASEEDYYITAPSWDAFTDSAKQDSIRSIIVMNSVVNSGDYDNAFYTYDFPAINGGELARPNLMDKKINIYYVNQSDTILIHNRYRMDDNYRNITVINGVVHQMHDVITSRDVSAADYLQQLIDKKQEGYLVMARAIQACGLFDTLRAVRDETYETMYQTGQIPNLEGMTTKGFAEGNTAEAPEHRKYGFTIFAETDDFWREQGLDPQDPNLLEDLQQWIYDNHQYSDEDKFDMNSKYSSGENLLYQWVTYHMLPMKIPNTKLVYHANEFGWSYAKPQELTIPVYELYASFGKRRLIKIYESKESNGVYLNRFAIQDNGRHGTNHEIGCDPDKIGCRVNRESEMAVLTDITNCNIYPIDAPLAYTDEVRKNFHRQRLRFDGMSMLHESVSNDIRKFESEAEKHQHVYIPPTSTYPYFDNMVTNDQANFVYYNAYKIDYPNNNSDEMKAVGRFEFTFKLHPVPRKGTYELRYSILNTSARGIVQMYLGTDPNNLTVTGIPVDLTSAPQEFERDTEDDDYNAEVEKFLRNKNYMKGSKSACFNGDASRPARDNSTFVCLRHIVTRAQIDPDKTYYLKVKSVLDSDRKEFYMDYLEWCPKEVYDNPNTPEDIW